MATINELLNDPTKDETQAPSATQPVGTDGGPDEPCCTPIGTDPGPDR